ncbi:NAD-dependent epimerase/dehydratase family protein [Faecalibaculum rodentium]|uniref:Nucleoside-diphosphate sugar epimerase n=1 Tax=Faecalibaculum rodentium TaxID=1702221 RepID=A0A1Q9YHR5_9FIRM|nr:NAD(P)-dependent oxidoreductase [Faecalibaculum rodentium]OLU43725.1 nucleoside-diphosphate sugar epimerase [Faecalibaculum rodentium]
MRILVTGANGYLGKGVVRQLLDDGIEVIATSSKDNLIDSRAKVIISDLFSVQNPYEFFGKPDAVLHMAWRDGFLHNSVTHINDLAKHYKFLSTLAEAGVKQIACMGSMHEIGFFEGSIDESTPCNPQSLYGISKNALKDLLRLKCDENKVIFQWLRGFYIVGNTEDGCSIFSKIIQAAHNGDKHFPFTMGLNQFDFLDYDDFCKYIADCVEQTDIDGIINICSGRPEKLADRVERFIKDNKLEIELDYGQFPDRPYDSKAVWGNDYKIKRIESKLK